MKKCKKLLQNLWDKGGLWVLAAGLVVIILAVFYLFSLPDGKLRVTFCNVGQGDGIYIDLPDGQDILVDGGPGRAVLECIGKRMPFWDRKIEMVLLTHPQADHLNGLVDVLKRYEAEVFVASPVGNKTKGYKELIRVVKKKNILVKNVYAGDRIKFSDKVSFRVLWPSRKYTDNVLGVSSDNTDLNDFSLVLELKFWEFEVLLTADADEGIQDEIMAESNIDNVEIFKVPHHGSKYAILDEYLDKAKPIFAVISVGKNRWGHPSGEIIERLEKRRIRVLRTDRNGDITIVSNGKQYWIESDKN